MRYFLIHNSETRGAVLVNRRGGEGSFSRPKDDAAFPTREDARSRAGTCERCVVLTEEEYDMMLMERQICGQ